MKNVDFSKKYLCHAATPKIYLNYGAVGTVQNLEKWLEDCFPYHKYPFDVFFEGYSEKEILDYIYTNAGFRLTSNFEKYL